MRLLSVSLLVLSGAAAAQAPDVQPADQPAMAQEAEAAPVNEDEMADLLNSQQQIRQGVTLTRSIDGTVVETRKETITYSPDDPLRGSEAALSPIERLKAEFASDALTRKEAFEEAKLDFVIADLNRDDKMDESEFVFLVNGWQDATVSGSGRSRFVDPTPHADEAAAKAEHDQQARAKFSFIAGGAATVSRKDYMREVLIDFDAFDKSGDSVLTGDELLNFRAANRGESIADQSATEVEAESVE